MIFFSMLGEPLFYHLAIELFADHVSPEKQETLFLTVHFCVAGKFGALFASIPFTIFAAVYCVLFGLVG
jgi:nucleobase transporter 1/2